MSEHIYKRHNKSLLLYHIVCPAKYRKKVFTEKVAETLKEVCMGIDERYEIHFVEIGVDEEDVHFLVQSVPMLSPRDIVQTIKSITGKEIFKRHPEVKKLLWGGNFWTSGYYVNTVGRYGNEEAIANYVKSQGRKYQQIYRNQLELFDDHIQ
ncbi:MAG: IS200/IS605 family transposase [Thermodesulfovibrionales bacterium]|nr:IS200/IS605 family transposase [Thermodesulfovibrionales bacterium]